MDRYINENDESLWKCCVCVLYTMHYACIIIYRIDEL